MATAVTTIRRETAKAAPVSLTPHFSVNRNDLVRELSLAIGAVEKRSTIPILGNVKLEASDFGHLAITATDLEIGLSCRCDATVKKPGFATLPAKRLLDYVRLLPEGPIGFTFGDTQWATITAGRSKTRIPGMSVESFPDLPSPGETTCSIPAKTIARLIQQTSYAISMEESRFTLGGALFEIHAGNLRMVATDGHRLTVANCAGQARKDDKNLIPRKALTELIRFTSAAPADSTVEFSTDDNHVFFAIGDRVMTSRRLSGSFPDYARILPASFLGTATANRLELRAAITRARGFADERSHAMKVVIAEGQIAIFANALESGDSEETVSAEVNGSVTMGFNADYLLDFLGATEAERVVISFGDDKAAIQLIPAGDDAPYLCIVMPLRI